MNADELQQLNRLNGWLNAMLADGRVVATQLASLIAGNTPPAPLIYSQRNPLWSNNKLGTGSTTIGQEGCLMTCAAQMLTELKHAMTPGELNLWLMANGGYVAGNHFVYASIDKIGATKFRVLGSCVNVPAPIALFNDVLAHDGYVIAEVDFSPAPGVQQHWVIYRGNDQVTDPWYGDQSSITRYGKDAETAIINYAIYDKVTA